ncbi:helicase-related protein [Haladaptatus sp. ZSTT2]|uniref:helicase-related protein n=1 Tax=Haladaptatus sp. ZSTT2 TaxID=3120515 RepID=UPI00300EA18F
MVDDNGRIRNASDFPGGLPCFHENRRETYSKSKRYDSMLRSPANVAVTTARYLLRSLADPSDPETFEETKLLSFADSQADMKQLERNFREPEESFFFDQLFVESVRSEVDNSGWAPLSAVIERGKSAARQYEADLAGDSGRPPKIFENLLGYDQSENEYLVEEMVSRVLPGKYSERYRGTPLLDEGLVDIRLTDDIGALSDGEREILSALISQNHRYEPSLIEEVEGGQNHIELLIEKGYVNRTEDDGSRYVLVNEEKVECAVVGDETPAHYSPSESVFITSLSMDLIEAPNDVVEFTIPLKQRAIFSHPHFSLRAQQVTTGDPMMLLARAYYGQTDREERRKLEYQFRQGRYPHFLSSGPAMELGVDIGDLNTLLLYGTPPNANSYLQRIGRAGRASGNSLIHSVSQRNPIDYYYYEHPEELIASDPQQVPLNEVNREVLHQSLTWAILDWVTSTYWLPWRRDQTGLDDYVVCKEPPTPRTDPRPNDVLPFTGLLASSNTQVQHTGEEAPLEALRSVIDDNPSSVEQWLTDILAFGSCSVCGRKHAQGYNGSCNRPECSGTVEPVLDMFDDVIASVLTGTPDHKSLEETIIDLYDTQWAAIDSDLIELEDERSDIRRETRRSRDLKQKKELEEQKQQIRRRINLLSDYLTRLEGMDFGKYLSRESPSAFGLRSVGDVVDYQLIGEDFETVNDGTRDRRIALSELHPGSAYLHDGETYVVTRVYWEPLESARLSEAVEDTAICPTCAEEYDTDTSHCTACGTRLKRLVTKVPERIIAYQHDLPLGSTPNAQQLQPASIYQSSQEVQGTYAPVVTDAGDSFDPSVSYDIVDEEGTVHGRFEYGDVTIHASTTKFLATYKDGGTDPLPNVFEMCGVEGCSGVVATVGDSACCTNNPEHPTRESIAVRPATRFNTKAVRVQFDNKELEHGFAHGLRVALQYIGGVSVRQVPESIEDDGTLVYDSDEGGSGITVLLTQDDGKKFEQAIRIMRDAFLSGGSKCNCENGCPFCIYQYGCVEQNDPESFEKDELLELLANDLHLESRTDD